MSSVAKRFLKDSSLYSLEPILTKAITFFLVPLYTAYLSPADYGNLQYILTFGAFYAATVDLGLFSSFWKYRTANSPYNKAEVTLNIVLSFLATGFGILFMAALAVVILDRGSLTGWLIIVYFVAALVRKVFETSLLLLRANFRVAIYLTASVLHAAILIGTNILFVVTLGMNYKGVIWGYLVTAAVTTGAFLFVVLRDIGGSFNRTMTRDLLVYGIPIMVGNVASIAISMSDRIFLKHFASDAELGLYSYGYKFAELVQVFLVNTFYMAWNPLRWEIYERPDGKEVFARFYRIFLVLLPVCATAALGVILVVGPAITADHGYLPGFRITPLVGLSFVVQAMYYFNAMGMLFENRTKTIMGVILASGAVSLVMNAILIPRLGVLGAALSNMASTVTMLTLGRFYSQRFYPIARQPWRECFQGALLLLLATYFTVALSAETNPTHVGLTAFPIALVCCLGNLLLGNISLAELRSLARMVMKRA
jgi:O-antigen/teichoic acid export membrane protein